MATSNREWAARGGWGVGAVSNFNALPSNRSLLDHANAIDGVRGGTYPLPGAVMMSAWRRPDGALVVSGSDGVDRVVGSQEIRTPEDADRLFGKGFGLGIGDDAKVMADKALCEAEAMLVAVGEIPKEGT